jgi:hypothetical protein
MFDINDRVNHWNYGDGTVLEAEIDGVTVTYTLVRFDDDVGATQVCEHDLELIDDADDDDDGAWDDYQERQWERRQMGLCRF